MYTDTRRERCCRRPCACAQSAAVALARELHLVGARAVALALVPEAVAFAFLAFWDLAHRDHRDVVGSKPMWVPVILVNWIGPAAYFLVGIRR